MCKFGTRGDAQILREDVRVRDARERIKAHIWCEIHEIHEEPQEAICEVCGYEDVSVVHGICADCRQGNQIG